jgi:hypothetical protein
MIMRPIQRYSPMTLRSTGSLLVLCVGVLWVGPLAGQDPIVIPQAPIENTINLPPLQITNEITVMSDSAMIANLNRNLEALRLEIAAQECNTCGGSNLVRAGQGALVLIAAFMAWQVKKIADKPNGDDVHNEGDTNVTVESNDHDHGRRKDRDHDES